MLKIEENYKWGKRQIYEKYRNYFDYSNFHINTRNFMFLHIPYTSNIVYTQRIKLEQIFNQFWAT